MKFQFVFIISWIAVYSQAQVSSVIRSDPNKNNSGKLKVGGYIDAYYGYDFNKPLNGDRPYSVSMARHNEININLAYLSVEYQADRVRGKLIPAVGTYMNATYAQEPGTLKNIVEGYAGIKLFKSKSIWLDIGVLGSPYSGEGPVSKDQLAYTRSIGAENSPYYLSGAKLSAELSAKIKAYLFLINGWQQIQDQNSKKSIGTQLEVKPNEKWLASWNTYMGNESSVDNPDFDMRYFTELYFNYAGAKWSVAADAYAGLQKRIGQGNATWWQANIIARYAIAEKISITGRMEYFHDADNIIIKPITSAASYECYGSSIGLNGKPADNILLRLEWRTFYSPRNEFIHLMRETNTSNWITFGIAIGF